MTRTATRTHTTPKPPRSKASSCVLDKIKADEALTILRELADQDRTLRVQIENLARAMFSNVSVEDVASEVYFGLDTLVIEDVWDNSGPSRYGYTESGGVAHKMIEEALHLHWDEMKRHQKLGMKTEAMLVCFGILKGIERYQSESKSEFKDWAADSPDSCFCFTLDQWLDGCKSSEKCGRKMVAFLAQNYHELEDKVVKYLNRRESGNHGR